MSGRDPSRSVSSVNRRTFLLAAGGVAASLMIDGPLVTAASSSKSSKSGKLTGFIVSDAHMGWLNAKQPAVEEQARMMQRILKRFGDLDVVIDTGDAHHNYAKEQDLGNWTDNIAGECGTLPLYYVAGNHEIAHNNDCDRELRSNRLGSVTCRPYYSFDIKGVHFVSLPEMLGANLVTNEALDWVELDLAVNSGKTTIVLSHNSIANTTLPHNDRGYRQLANSEKVFDFLNRYPNVIAWMHGHNHTWEVIRKRGKFYVSNGRIGGFYPPEQYGGNRLGGIYFEVTKDRVAVRGWSATDGKFFDEISPDYAWLSQSISMATSFDSNAPAAVCYGAGGVKDGERMVFTHHHAGSSAKSELFISGVRDKVFNENAEIAYYGVRPEGQRMMPAIDVAMKGNEKDNWEWIFPGIRIHPAADVNDPVSISIPDRGEARNAYYRCAPGKKYKSVLDIRSFKGGQDLQLQCYVFSSKQVEVARLDGPKWTLREGYQVLEAVFEIPQLKDKPSIYNDLSIDDNYQISVVATMTKHDNVVELRRFELMIDGADGETVNPAVTIDGKRHAVNSTLSCAQMKRFTLQPFTSGRSVAAFEAAGNGRLTWLVRQTGLDWQVRNASTSLANGWLEIGPLRNTFSQREEVVIAPLRITGRPFVHRLRHIQGARILQPSAPEQALKIDVRKLSGPAGEIEIVTDRKPAAVTGGESWDYRQGRLIIKVIKAGMVTVS